MNSSLKSYPAYKDSDVSWLGEVPEHWEVTSVKRHYNIQLGKMLQNLPLNGNDIQVPYFKAQHVQWFHVRTDTLPTMWANPCDIAQFGASEGDLLVCEGGEGGRSGILRENVSNCIIQNALHRVRPLGQNSVIFLQYIMSIVSARGWFNAINSLATIAHFTSEKFGSLQIPVPPEAEQLAIVRYLDYMDSRIGKLINAKQKLVKLLEEQKQAIIHRAVTRGLDPNVRLKPSGVEWLGEVPEHWELLRLKHLVRNVIEQTATKHSGEVYIALEHVVSWTGEILPPNGELAFESNVKKFRPNDVLFGKLRPYLAKVARPQISGVCVGEFLVLRAFEQVILPDYLEHKLRSRQYIDIINSSTFGAKMPRADWTFIGNLVVAFPPSQTEQSLILNNIARQTETLQSSIEKTKHEIELLREYRTRLISDVVTGKLDVREAAAELPEEVEEAAVEEIDESVEEDLREEVSDEVAE